MPIKDDTSLIAIYVDQKEKDICSKYAKKMDMSLSSFCRKLILMGLDDVKMLDGIGMVSMARYMRDLIESHKEGGVFKEASGR